MAAGNRSVGLQISLALFAMLAVLGWVLFYMQYRELGDKTAEFQKKDDDLKEEQNLTRKQDADIQELMKLVGHPNMPLGTPADNGPGSVFGEASQDLARAQGLANQNYSSALQAMETRILALESELQQSKLDNDVSTKNSNSLRSTYSIQVTEANASRDDAVKAKMAAITSKAEAVQAKQVLLDDLQRTYNELQVEYDDAKAAWDDEKEVFETKLGQLNKQVDDLREKLKKATRVSFEREDGLVRWVDNTAGMVWVNLGSDDGLRIKTTFAVYTKDHHGVGRRGAEDIKGQIEVTRILGAHSAEARILNDALYDPIAKGDPIYTPLWSPGRTERFAIVGLVDLDQDGIGDRERFHEIVAAAGAKLTHEIDDDGNRNRFTKFPDEWVEWNEGDAELPSDTKYLIIADIPDPALALLDADKEKRQKISGQLDRLRDEARRLGIEEINLNDFLSHIGYRPQRRLYIPGVAERPFNLRAGGASVSTSDGPIGNRATANPVSGLYGRSRRLKPKTSSGQTSKLYGRGKGNY